MKNIKNATDAIRKELSQPLPDHQPEKEKKMATKKKGKKSSKKVSKKASKKVTKKVNKKVAKKGKKGSKKVAKKAVDGTTLADLAAEAKISGQKARQLLRKGGVEREKGSRWVFTNKSELKQARKALGL